MNEQERINDLEKLVDSLRRENEAMRRMLEDTAEKLEVLYVIEELRSRLCKEQEQQPASRGRTFEPDDDVKQALRELAEFNRSGRSGQRRKELKNYDDRQTQQ